MSWDQLLNDGADPKDICYRPLSYQGQYEIYRVALRNLQKSNNPAVDLKAIRVKKIDRYQGGEATYST